MYIITQPPRSSNSQRPLQPQMPRTRAHRNRKLARRQHPLLGRRIPVASVLAAQRELDGAALAGRQVELLEAAQLAHGGINTGGGGQRQVELGDLGAGDVAGVGDGGGDAGERGERVCRGRVVGGGCGGGDEVGVGEVGVCWWVLVYSAAFPPFMFECRERKGEGTHTNRSQTHTAARCPPGRNACSRCTGPPRSRRRPARSACRSPRGPWQ